MKKWLALALLTLSSTAFADSNCNLSQLTIVNKSDGNLTVMEVSAQHHFPEIFSNYSFDWNGYLDNLNEGQTIAPNNALNAYAYTNSGSRGHVRRNIRLLGDKGVVDIDISFKSLLWGFGTCRVNINSLSDNYNVVSAEHNGVPASADIEIY